MPSGVGGWALRKWGEGAKAVSGFGWRSESPLRVPEDAPLRLCPREQISRQNQNATSLQRGQTPAREGREMGWPLYRSQMSGQCPDTKKTKPEPWQLWPHCIPVLGGRGDLWVWTVQQFTSQREPPNVLYNSEVWELNTTSPRPEEGYLHNWLSQSLGKFTSPLLSGFLPLSPYPHGLFVFSMAVIRLEW